MFHENGIAVILDLTMNHSFGRNSLVRMWMDDPDKNGWGGPSSDNPYYNVEPKHSYNVGYDFNHQSELTQEYTKELLNTGLKSLKLMVLDGILPNFTQIVLKTIRLYKSVSTRWGRCS